MATIRDAVRLIQRSRGKIFRATFVKRNGEIRHLVGRTGVSKDIKGTGLAFDPAERGLMTVWDMRKGAWRMINLNTLLEVRALGETVEVGERERAS